MWTLESIDLSDPQLLMKHELVAAGYDAYSVAGGTSAWARSGRPVATGTPRA